MIGRRAGDNARIMTRPAIRLVITVLAALIAADAASRLSAVLIMAGLPPARKEGLSASAGRPSATLAMAAFAVTFILALLLHPFRVAVLLLLSAAISAVVVGAVALKRLGGQTGDVLGASSQLCQCLALTVLVIARA